LRARGAINHEDVTDHAKLWLEGGGMGQEQREDAFAAAHVGQRVRGRGSRATVALW
jgi:hypothetical protein